MDSMQVVGGLKIEIKCEPGDNVVEIGFNDILNDDEYNDDPFNVDDDDDPFNSDDDIDSLFDQNTQSTQLKSDKVKISREAGNESMLHPRPDKSKEKIVITNDCKEKDDVVNNMEQEANNDGPRDTKGSRDKVSLQMEEKLVLNYTRNEDLPRDNLPEVKKTSIPSSFVADTEYTVEGDRKYRCNHCQVRTTTKKNVLAHIRHKHRGVPREKVRKTHDCPYCPFKSKGSGIKSHIIHRHIPDSEMELFKCAHCDHKSKTKSLLCKHLLSHLNPMQMMDRMKKCDQCPKMYKSTDTLQRHKLFIHKKHLVKKLKCTECEYETVGSTSLRRHKGLLHSDTENSNLIECPNCTYKTLNAIRFQDHLLRNHLEKRFQCEKCSYRTPSIHKLKLHLITHQEIIDEKDLKYRCDKCDYKTYQYTSFRVHKLKHLKPEEIQYFYCYHCKFKAKRKDNLKTHVLRHFKHNEVAFQCFSCEFSTKKREKITAHISKHSKAQKK